MQQLPHKVEHIGGKLLIGRHVSGLLKPPLSHCSPIVFDSVLSRCTVVRDVSVPLQL